MSQTFFLKILSDEGKLSILVHRMEQDGEKKVGALLQTVDELVKIAPDLVPGGKLSTASMVNFLFVSLFSSHIKW